MWFKGKNKCLNLASRKVRHMKVLVTGVAGFIGMHVATNLLKQGHQVCGLDSLNDYYDVNLKRARLRNLEEKKGFSFHHLNIAEAVQLGNLFHSFSPHTVINLAAQAGVRYSLENPSSYVESNLVGFSNILEASRRSKVKHLIYASSSSVYGSNTSMPFSEEHNVDHPVALYGATKKANELLAHSYSHLFNLPTTGLRFFTVYGPWGRPDMALFKFTEALFADKHIDVFNHGDMMRDFTYIDDVVDGIIKVLGKPAELHKNYDSNYPDAGLSSAPWRVFNIGRGKPLPLVDFIHALEAAVGKKAHLKFLDMQPGDVQKTFADTHRLENWVDWKPKTSIETGISAFVKWYENVYRPNFHKS